MIQTTNSNGFVLNRPVILTERPLLEHPSGMRVELIGSMGGDIDIVNAARVSYGKESDYELWRMNPDNQFEKYGEANQHYHTIDIFPHYNWTPCLASRDAGLINYLMRERHGTPFEMVQLKFRVKAPIGVIWEWVRHRIASYNIMSTRYVEWNVDWYTPQAEQWREQVGKPGHYEFVPLVGADLDNAKSRYQEAMQSAFEYYGMLLDSGLAKEVARNVLPMGAMTEMIWSVNLRSLFNFLSLRTAPPALEEIRICANMVQDLTKLVVPETMQMWLRHEKGTP